MNFVKVNKGRKLFVFHSTVNETNTHSFAPTKRATVSAGGDEVCVYFNITLWFVYGDEFTFLKPLTNR